MVETYQTYSSFSGRVALSYETAFGLTPFANYSTSFSPNLGFVYDASDIRRTAAPTKAEQIELGVKYQVPDSNAVLSAAFFDISQKDGVVLDGTFDAAGNQIQRSEEHTSELQSLMRISYAVFCLKKKNKQVTHTTT